MILPSKEAVAERFGVVRIERRKEGPIGGLRKFAIFLAGLRVPDQGPVVLATGDQDVWIVLAPRERQDALLMTLKCPLGRVGVAEIPQKYERSRVVGEWLSRVWWSYWGPTQ